MTPFQPSDPKAPPPDLNLPVFMGPLTLPQMPQPKRKRRWKLFLLWSFLMFAGGAVAGVVLIDEVSVAIERVTSTLGLPTPRFVTNRRPVVPAPSPVVATPASVPEPAPEPAPTPELAPAAAVPSVPAGEGAGQAVVTKPAAIPAKVKPEAEQPAQAPAPREPKRQPVAAAPARVEPVAATEPPAVRAPHGKGAAKSVSSAGPSAKKSVKFDDPFAGDGETANEAKPASASGKAKPSEPVAAAKSEPATKATAAKSRDPLDNLMDDGMAASKGKKRDSKDLDALLKDVQKSEPAPQAKHEPPPPASALSPADISRVMAGVKTRSNDCARRLGQKGNAELKITVGKDGRVSDVNLGGNLAGSPLGACIDKATRAATFPASSGLKFDYRIDAR